MIISLSLRPMGFPDRAPDDTQGGTTTWSPSPGTQGGGSTTVLVTERTDSNPRRDWLTGEPGKVTIFIPLPEGSQINSFLRWIGRLISGAPEAAVPGAALTEAAVERLEQAAQSGPPVIRLITNLTQAPAVNRALSTATTLDLATKAREGGRIFTGDVPLKLIYELEKRGLVQKITTEMGGVVGYEYKFAADAARFVVGFFVNEEI